MRSDLVSPKAILLPVALPLSTRQWLQVQAEQRRAEPEQLAAQLLIGIAALSPKQVQKLFDSMSLTPVSESEAGIIPSRALLSRFTGLVADAAANAGGKAAASGHFVAGHATGAYDRTEPARKFVGRTLGLAKEAAGSVPHVLTRSAYPVVANSTEILGRLLDALAENEILRGLAAIFNAEQWLDFTEQIDVEKAQAAVDALKEQHLDESSAQIARRLMVQKALYTGSVGFATSVIPGSAATLLALDVVSTAALQAELVYQIAAAYDLPLDDPARKGEVLAVFGCVLGTTQAVKAGLAVLRNAPVAGALIGASSNAAMLYALGYAACRFYEERLYQEERETLPALEEQSGLFLEAATAQQAVADQVLLCIIRAGQPDASADELVQSLPSLNLSPVSLQEIAAHLNDPPSLTQLLPQLDRDFALYLLGQCQRIAQSDGVVNEAEADVLETLADYFEIELALANRTECPQGSLNDDAFSSHEDSNGTP